MGWYLRKSFSFGPLRLNLSKSGLGYSLGVKGARIGVGPRGTYIHAGRGGFYYRKYLSGAQRSHPAPLLQLPSPGVPPADGELANRIETASAEALRDSTAEALLSEIRANERKVQLAPIVVALTALAVFSALMVKGYWMAGGLLFVGVGLHVWALRSDYRRKATHLHYQLSGEFQQAFVEFLQTCERLSASSALWRVTSTEENFDTKYHAGAQVSLNRKPARASFDRPRFLETEIATWRLDLGNQALYFFPDRLMIYESGTVGAVGYSDVNLAQSPLIFVEAQAVPSDTQVVGRTWRYTNKGGGPDRRFANNPEIPLVRYGQIALRSTSGMNFLIQVSDPGKAEAFVSGVKRYVDALRSMSGSSSAAAQ